MSAGAEQERARRAARERLELALTLGDPYAAQQALEQAVKLGVVPASRAKEIESVIAAQMMGKAKPDQVNKIILELRNM